MNFFRLTATLKAPLIIQCDRQSNVPAGLPYIPGSSWRGALAAAYLRQGGSTEDDNFRTLFGEEPISFPFLYPSKQSKTISRVLPLTAHSCKREGGFLGEGHHGVLDTLAVNAGNRLLGRMSDADLWLCPGCGQDIKPFQGFWNADETNPLTYEVCMIFDRHTGIDRVTGTVAQGIFYTSQAVADFQKDSATGDFQPQYFTGGMFLDREQYALLSSTLSSHTLFIGADRTRGFGEVDLILEEHFPFEFDLFQWNSAFQAKFFNIFGQKLPAGLYFSLKLESPAICVDKFLRPVGDLDLVFPGLETVLTVGKQHIIRGWQSSWGLPKPDDLALSPGSVFLLRYQGEDLDGLKDFMNRIMVSGIGLRRAEGFGKVSFCEPIHLKEVI
jgi:CRISPR-associated protein Csx10